MTVDDDKDVLAAEYVLGTLDGDDRANVGMLLAIDPGFAATVAKWERRIGELHALVDPVEPPKATWDWIQARIAGVPPSEKLWLPSAEDLTQAPPARAPDPSSPVVDTEVDTAADVAPPSAEVISLHERVRLWRGRATVIGALAASIVAVVVARELHPDLMPAPLKPAPVIVEKPVEVVRTVEVPSPRMAEFVAVFQKDETSPQFLLTVDVERKTMSLRRVGAEQPQGKSYELWILPAGATAPRSLGLVGDQEFTVRRALGDYDAPTLNNATFGVSVEPAGGSPTGAPTGPVIHGKLIQATPPAFPQATP
jgi:anti-sigma-K factor RskA